MRSAAKKYRNSPDSAQDLSINTATVRTGSTTSQVATKLRNRILEGQYAFDERLPAERHLAEEFNVSRGTIRSVLQILEDQNLVTRQVGSGTYISHRELTNQQEISSITSPLEMVEVRIALEPQIVKLAIVNASFRDLQHLQKTLKQCESCDGDAEKFASADTAFHMALAQCSRNKLLYWVYERISEVRRFSQWRSVKAKVLTPERINDYNRQHRAIYEAIAERDAPKAVSIIKKHLHGIHDDLLET